MIKTIKLSNSNEIPCIGFGTYKLNDENELDIALNTAINSDYTMIDTAHLYQNEALIGNIIKNSCKNREDLIIATKVWPSDFGYDKTMYSIERSLKLLKTDYIDIMYLHWPGDYIVESYRAFERMYDEKVIKNLAVANFLPKHYEEIISSANVAPVINQIEIHPYNQAIDLVDYYKSKNIQIVSWSPIARGGDRIFNNSILIELSQKYNKTISQIVLRWHIQRGLIVIPKSKTPHRIIENISIFDFCLSDEDMLKIRKLDENKAISHSPNEKKWLKYIQYEM